MDTTQRYSMSKEVVTPESNAAGHVLILSDNTGASWHESLMEFLKRHDVDASTFSTTTAIGRVAWEQFGGSVERLFRQWTRRSNHVTDDLSSTASSDTTIVLCDSPASAASLKAVRQVMGSKMELVAVVNDFEAPFRWRDLEPDRIICPTAAQAHVLFPRVADRNRYALAGPAGIPTLPDVANARVRQALHIVDDTTRIAVVDTTWMQAAHIRELIELISANMQKLNDVKWIFGYGEQDEHARVIRKTAAAMGIQAHMFGGDAQWPALVAEASLWVGSAKNASLMLAIRANIPALALGAPQDHALVELGLLPQLQRTSDLVDALVQWRTGAQPDAASTWPDDLRAQMTEEAVGQAVLRFLTTPVLVGGGDEDAESSPGPIGLEAIGAGVVPSASISKATTRQKSPISSKELRNRMARLLLEQRALEATHKEAVEERDRWMQRIRDAEEAHEDDLREFAMNKAEIMMKRLKAMQRELDEVEEQKQELRARYSGADTASVSPGVGSKDAVPPDVEARFRQLDEQRQLRELRARAASKP